MGQQLALPGVFVDEDRTLVDGSTRIYLVAMTESQEEACAQEIGKQGPKAVSEFLKVKISEAEANHNLSHKK